MQSNPQSAYVVGSAASAGNAIAPRELSPMEQAMNETSNAIHALVSAVDRVEQRMTPVLRSVPPATESKTGTLAGVPSTSMAVEQMHIQRRQLDVLIARVNDLTERLDT